MDLFPGLFQDGTFLIPTGSLTEEVTIDLVFSRNGTFANDERAVFMPSLSSFNKSYIAQVEVSVKGDTGNAANNEKDVVLIESRADPDDNLDSRLVVDIANGKTDNVRVLDGGRGFNGNDLVEYDREDPQPQLTTKLEVFVGY
jgi:hypothetical protein